MKLTPKEYELAFEVLTQALATARRHIDILEDGQRGAQAEIERLRLEARELRGAARVADAEALLLKSELDARQAKRSAAARKANATRRARA